MSLLPILVLFGVGYLTWSLALVRTFALLKQRKVLVSSLIFVEETVMLLIGVWLAERYQVNGWKSLPEIISCALGGASAAFTVMITEDRKSSQG